MLSAIKSLTLNALSNTFGIRTKPRVIQLPITSRCNSRCVTCNVWKHKDNTDINPQKLAKVFADPFYNKVKGVGVNGGEITLVPNIDDIIDAVLTLPSLQSIYVISNGLLPDKLLDTLHRLKSKINAKGVKLSLQLSVDGIGKIHEKTRGVPNCFPRTVKILDAIKADQARYCDAFSVGCTISQSNVSYLREVVEFFNIYPFDIYYHLAVPNKRIHTFGDSDGYYVVSDERSRLLAMEFFQERMSQLPGLSHLSKRFVYFSSYYFLKNRGKGRLSSCNYRYRDITIDENLNVYYCATASNLIGSLLVNTTKSLIGSTKGKQALRDVKSNCDTCVHYSNFPSVKGLCIFGIYLIKRKLRYKKYPRK